MPNYKFKHIETGETKTVTLKISELDEWKNNNPDWYSYIDTPPMMTRDFGGSTISKHGSVEFEDKLKRLQKTAKKDYSSKIFKG